MTYVACWNASPAVSNWMETDADLDAPCQPENMITGTYCILLCTLKPLSQTWCV